MWFISWVVIVSSVVKKLFSSVVLMFLFSGEGWCSDCMKDFVVCSCVV